MNDGFQDKDSGMKKIRKELEALSHLSVKAGVVEGADDVDGVSVAQYAAWNEYGVPDKSGKRKWRIPPRPFIRGWTENNGEKIKRTVEKLTKQIANGKMDATTAVGRLGQFAQDGIKRYIRTGNFEPNAESTIRRKKGSSRPLIDTGTMRNSIRYEVVEVK